MVKWLTSKITQIMKYCTPSKTKMPGKYHHTILKQKDHLRFVMIHPFLQLFFFSVFLRVVGWTSNQKAVKMWHGWSFVSCANVVAGGAT